MHCFVTTGGPAGALAHLTAVRKTTDQDRAVLDLLKMALQAKVRVAFGEELGVHAAVGVMAGDAAFARCFVFKDVRATLRGMALEAIFFAC